MHTQALDIPWRSTPAFHVVVPFRRVQLADLPLGTIFVEVHNRQLLAALALADVVRTFCATLEHIVLQTPDPADRLATLARIYLGGAKAGLAGLATGAVSAQRGGVGIGTLRSAIQINASRSHTPPAALATAACSGARWFDALIGAFDSTTAVGAQRLRHQAANELHSLMEVVDALVVDWLAAHRPGIGIERTMPILRSQPERPPSLAIFPPQHRPAVGRAVA